MTVSPWASAPAHPDDELARLGEQAGAARGRGVPEAVAAGPHGLLDAKGVEPEAEVFVARGLDSADYGVHDLEDRLLSDADARHS